ncbi:transmembrane amino acid transporter protein-domain-containing protein [Pelagophyceae sp. CCMP2097]|nr:transmembrane amino acid transporter protein-domain-containing protein [Pelagophyceae sp. CCMP2097]|mmetsp:Transcript_27799/g.93456  ORF Transcript_27799/g.93456 Transcript_27799/m.93456 type:complete len:435 (+) Transcript_27799:33-1337(+)
MAINFERLPLRDAPAPHGAASVAATTVNLIKVCIGTGVLAIPHAFASGGVVLMLALLLLITFWTEWCSRTLLRCRSLLTDTENDGVSKARGETSFAALARAAAGAAGSATIDTLTATLMFGVCIAYFVAFKDFISATPVAVFGTPYVAAVAALPLAMVSDIGQLAPVASCGLAGLGVAFVAIVWHGVSAAFSARKDASTDAALAWVSTTRAAAASGFGTLSFCFGGTPLVLQIEATMREPSSFVFALRCALTVTCVIYFFFGTGVACLYSRDGGQVNGDILDNLPRDGLDDVVRCAMALACIASAPLAIVTAGEVIEKRAFRETAPAKRLAVRSALALSAAAVAAALPLFAIVVSLVGGFLASLLSFIVPPLLHLLLSQRARRREGAKAAPCADVAVDAAALLLGVAVVVFATALTVTEAEIDVSAYFAAKATK